MQFFSDNLLIGRNVESWENQPWESVLNKLPGTDEGDLKA